MTHRVFKMIFADLYPMYVQKALRKDRTQAEVDELLLWLTGYTPKGLTKQIEKKVTVEEFFNQAPLMNPKREEIKGVVCGVRVENVEDPLMREIRYLDKLIDELAKGKVMEKIKRS